MKTIFKCPNCGSIEEFKMLSSCLVDLFFDGKGNRTDIQYKEMSEENKQPVICSACDYEGTTTEFAQHFK